MWLVPLFIDHLVIMRFYINGKSVSFMSIKLAFNTFLTSFLFVYLNGAHARLFSIGKR